MVLSVHRDHKVYWGQLGGGGGGVGRLYTYRYTVTTRMTPVTDHSFWRERRTEADSNLGPSAAYQPNALPLGHTGSQGGISQSSHMYPDVQPNSIHHPLSPTRLFHHWGRAILGVVPPRRATGEWQVTSPLFADSRQTLRDVSCSTAITRWR